MFDSNRRAFLGALALGAGGLAATRSLADDGHAAGYDVTSASNFMQTVPRKSGDPLKFSFPLDSGPIKATSGGWARDFNSARFPIATDIAGAHLFLNPGAGDSGECCCGVREGGRVFPRSSSSPDGRRVVLCDKGYAPRAKPGFGSCREAPT